MLVSRWAFSCRSTTRRRGGQAAAAALVMALAAGTASAGIGDAQTCDQAGAATEARLSLPPGLLRAIGRVESGRRDPITGSVAPWPWTINANGQGRFFGDAGSAAAAVRAVQASGTASVDIGCYQVNLMHHPLAFPRVEDGFDPAINAAYAGAFLQALRQRHGNWEAAVAAYHSATTERGEAYRTRVYAAWNPGASAVPLPPPRQIGPVVIRIAGPDLSAVDSVIRVWTPSRPGAAPARIAMPAPILIAPAMGGPMMVAQVLEAAPADAISPAVASAGGLPIGAMLPAALVVPAEKTPLPTP